MTASSISISCAPAPYRRPQVHLWLMTRTIAYEAIEHTLVLTEWRPSLGSTSSWGDRREVRQGLAKESTERWRLRSPWSCDKSLGPLIVDGSQRCPWIRSHLCLGIPETCSAATASRKWSSQRAQSLLVLLLASWRWCDPMIMQISRSSDMPLDRKVLSSTTTS